MKLDDAIAFVAGYGPNPLMATNICCRFILNLGAGLACWIPLSLFYRNRELAGVAMVISTAAMNFYYGINSAIWPTDDISAWFTGYGWCDVQLALWTPLETINAAAVCAVMQNIANQVSLMRASSLTAQEKRRKHIIQALIIFPIPVLQVVLYYFTIGMRYNISGILGCQAVFQANWIFLVFFILPCPIFSVAAAYYAALTWWRYRQIDANSRRALYNSGCYGAQARSARVRRKLYWMALTIVAPYCPMQLVFLFNNLRVGWPWSRTYDLAKLHAPGWAQIDYTPSTSVPFVSMYINYIVFLEVVVFFIYFGGTKDAHEMYRKYLRAIGLGKIFPRLNEPWCPSNRPPTTFKTLWPRAKSLSSFASSTHTTSQASSTYKAPTRSLKQPLNNVDDPDNFFNIHLDSEDLERATATLDAARSSTKTPQIPYRGAGVFRINIAPQFQVPKMLKTLPTAATPRSKAGRSLDCHSQSGRGPILPLRHSPLVSPAPSQASNLSTHGRGSRSSRREATVTPPLTSKGSGYPAVGIRGPTLSDYGRCLVSVKRDFSSPKKESDPKEAPFII